MTVAQGLNCSETDTIIQGAKTKFYPAIIPAYHHQLRYLISASEEDRIYYCNFSDVFALELSAGQRSLVATVPFSTRCLAARHGWICVGGETDGNCAFIRLERHASSDAHDEDSETLGRPRCFGHKVIVRELGGEIVNSMNIHQFPKTSDEEEPETVVLISNNDKTVKIYSLTRLKVLTTLKHSVPMNYAAISPDSTILVAVGDSNRIPFYKREIVDEKSASYNWRLFAGIQVPISGPDNDDHSFAVAFSPSGDLCAVSSMGGNITVIDLTNLEELAGQRNSAAAIVCSFKSSRPVHGSIRSMAFSPKPWDLLAWAEDHGRVGIADLRQFLIRRQILKLETHESLHRVDVQDLTPPEYTGMSLKEKLNRQHRERLNIEQGAEHGVDHEAEHDVEMHIDTPPEDPWAEEARRQQGRRQTLSYDAGLDLDSRERSVLDTLETTMDDIQHSTFDPRHPYSVSYTSSPRVRPSAGTSSTTVEQANRTDRAYMPRRRSSVVLSPHRTENETHPSSLAPRELSRSRLTASPSHMAQSTDRPLTPDDLPPLMSTNDLTPSAGGSSSQPLPYNIPPSDPWSTIQSALETARAADNDLATLRRLEETLDHEREANSSSTSNSTSASTTALPTTSTLISPYTMEATRRRHAALQNQQALQRREIVLLENQQSLQRRELAHLENQQGLQRREIAHLENIERLSRRVESRARIATSEIEALENAIMRGANPDRHARIIEQRAQARARAAAAVHARSQQEHNARVDAERYVTRTDELRRMRMLYGARQAIDQNGNWLVAPPRERSGELTITLRSQRQSLSQEEQRERGIGSAGVGWSPDGRMLYCGTEEGVFEFPLNVRDRMQFPACELR